MTTWTPLELFIYSVGLASVAAIGALLQSDKPLTIRTVLATILFHGSMGGGLGMAAYEYLSWQEHPWRILATAIFYGGGVVSFAQVRKLVQKIITGLQLSDATDKDNP